MRLDLERRNDDMKLAEMMSRSLHDILHDCTVVKVEPHATDDGTIKAITVKYIPPDTPSDKMTDDNHYVSQRW